MKERPAWRSLKKDNEGKDLASVVDKNGVKVIESLRDQAMRGGGFVNYVWPKPGAGDQPKVSYAEMIPGTQMWIGTGVYLDNIGAYQAQMASEIGKMAQHHTATMLAVTGTIFAATFIMVLFVAFSIVRALRAMIESFPRHRRRRRRPDPAYRNPLARRNRRAGGMVQHIPG
ncbi:MAG: cache domain-containing protein [bacterium]|nr:cache domain-containing protein [bacterium]